VNSVAGLLAWASSQPNMLSALQETSLQNSAVYSVTVDYTYTSNKLSSITGNNLNITFQYNGLGTRVGQTVNGVSTHFTVDLNAGLSQVLSDGTNTYLYGVGRIAQESTSGEQYFLADALGSVRQLVDANGSVQVVKSYEPYGEVLSSLGDGVSNYGFTGEWTDGNIELVNLRSRMYDPGTGRFLTRDIWQGDYNRPISYNGWLYGYGNPIRWVDRTGFSPQVNCEDMPTYLNLRTLCELGNGDDNDPAVLDAREQIFRIMVLGGKVYGYKDEGYAWAAKTLEHFLDGNGSQLDITFPPFNKFSMDPGIRRAIDQEIGPRAPGDEPATIKPLMQVFIERMQEAVENSNMIMVSVFLRGEDYYSPKGTQPRPYNTGFWAAFGHVSLNGRFSALGYYSCKANGYLIDYSANYNIEDYYDWFPGKKTPFDFPFVAKTVWIPHEWELSLVNSNPPHADKYNFTISWNERERISTSDFINFRPAGSWEQ